MEGTKKDEGITESNAVLTIVEREGSSYFVVDGDLRNGDRRADGEFMADFFNVVEGRERLKTKGILTMMQFMRGKHKGVGNVT